MEPWTPVPFSLLTGNPFSYALHSVSAISATEAFLTGIDLRDKKRCVVCGLRVALEHAHITVEDETMGLLYFFFASHHHLTVQKLDHTVAGDAQHGFHPSSGKVCFARGKEWCVNVQQPLFVV